MRVTLRDIAEKAGVSASTVSRVLNGKPDARVTDATRQTILDAAEDLGYSPNPFAQALKSGKSSLITLIAPQTEFLVSGRKVARLRDAMYDLHRATLTVDISRVGDPQRVVEVLLGTAPMGVVWLCPDWYDERIDEVCRTLDRHETYVLLADHQRKLPPDVPCDAITISRSHGSYLAVAHLIEQGCRDIGFIGLPAGGRIEGYERALSEAGLSRRHVQMLEGEDVAEEAADAARRLLRDARQLDAIFCYTDLMAASVLRALAAAEVRVPQDVALVGFDSDPWTAYLDVPLTTVAHPIERLCAEAIRMLRTRLDGDAGPWRRATLSPELVVRRSSQRRTAGQP